MSSDAADRLQEFRSLLDQRRQDEVAISVELETSRRAVENAYEALRRAEVLAQELEASARESAGETLAEASARAEQIVADAEARATSITATAEAAVARSLEDIDALADAARAALGRARTELADGERKDERRRNPFRSLH